MNFYSPQETKDIKNKSFAYLEISIQENILSITLNRPEKRNAMTPQMMNEIVFAIEHAKQNSDVRVVVLRANGTVFCAGADLKAFAGETAEKSSDIPSPKEKVRLGDTFKHLYKPCIAQVHSDVYAGGFLLIGGCTHVICSSNAKFGLPEINRGLWPFQVMATLTSVVDKRKLLDWCMRGNIIDAQSAMELGIVTQ
ncbi:MAG: enoyl-CoA hydratase/isomerase family protein, partial [Flavobacteriales bacterium]